jgi:hypothetical protein
MNFAFTALYFRTFKRAHSFDIAHTLGRNGAVHLPRDSVVTVRTAPASIDPKRKPQTSRVA